MRTRFSGACLGALLVLTAASLTGIPAAAAAPSAGALSRLIQAGRYAEAEQGARTLLAETESKRGPRSLATARAAAVLVDALLRGGKERTPETRQLAERVVAIRDSLLGPAHADLAQSLSDLALALSSSGEHVAAREAAERSLRMVLRLHGADHLSAASAQLVLGNVLHNSGQRDSARVCIDRALAIYERAPERSGVRLAAALQTVGELLEESDDYPGAKAAYQRSLDIREKHLGPDHPEVAKSLNSLATALHMTGDYVRSRELWMRALALTEKAAGAGHANVAILHNNLGGSYRTTADFALALEHFDRAVAGLEGAVGPDHPAVGGALSSRASVLFDSGDYRGASDGLERAHAIFVKSLGPRHPSVGSTLDGLGLALRYLGDYAGARARLQQALELLEESLGAESMAASSVLNNLAGLADDTGDFVQARDLLGRVLEIEEKALGTEHPEVSGTLRNLGAVLLNMGAHAEARSRFDRALAIATATLGADHPKVGSLHGALGDVMTETGDQQGAVASLRRGLTVLRQSLGEDHPDVGRMLVGLGVAHARAGVMDSAAVSLDGALAILARSVGAQHPDLGYAMVPRALLAVATGDSAAALRLALEADRIGREHLRLTGRGIAEHQALGYAATRASGLNVALTLAAAGVGDSARAAVMDAVVRSRAVVLDEIAARHRAVAGTRDTAVARLALELTDARARLAGLVVRGTGEQSPEVYRAALDAARIRRVSAEEALARASAHHAVDFARTRLGLEAVSSGLPPRSALVAYSLYTKLKLTPKGGALPSPSTPAYVAMVLRSGEPYPTFIGLGDAAEIDSLVARWKERVGRPVARLGRRAAEGDYRRAGAALRGRIWDPLAKLMAGAERAFVVPDGSLNLVNLATLPVDERGYLAERGPLLHHLSAERDLVPAAGVAAGGSGTLVVGGADYDSVALAESVEIAPGQPVATGETAGGDPGAFRGQRSACSDFRTLRFAGLAATTKESGEVAQQIASGSPTDAARRPLLLQGRAASEAAVKRLAPGRHALHLATHGFFLGGGCGTALGAAPEDSGVGGAKGGKTTRPAGENPLLLSGLALAGANRREAAGPGEEDGILTAEEIAALDLSGVEWAVLSACDTGVGELQTGEGVLGLRRAFQVAGARTLIMSLWPVEDEATRAWMRALYAARLGQGMDSAAAVREASLRVLRHRRAAGESTHPFFWGAFVAAGEWR